MGLLAYLADADAAFDTANDGLRGVPVIVMDRDTGELISARVYSNTATNLTLDVPLSRDPDQYDAYVLGAIPMGVESKDLTFGAPQTRKSLHYVTFEFERGGKGSFDFYLASDQESQTTTAWQYEGTVPLKGRTDYRLPLDTLGSSGRIIRYQIVSITPGQLSVINHMTFDYEIERDFE